MGLFRGKDGLKSGVQVLNQTAEKAMERESLAEKADPRLAVFCAGEGPEVFRSVCHRHEIWREDPFDVPTIHEEARDVFARLLNQATTPPGNSRRANAVNFGRIRGGQNALDASLPQPRSFPPIGVLRLSANDLRDR